MGAPRTQPLASASPKMPARAPAQGAAVPGTPSMASDAVRARMVQKLAAQGIADTRVLHAMASVDRHRFVDSALVNQAYEDTSLPIGLGQTISKPSVVARMIELLLGAPALAGQPAARDRHRLRLPGRGAEPCRQRGLQHRAAARPQ
jgi:protein-L-isoaspartate(D-aspartate) O-methyltransferase